MKNYMDLTGRVAVVTGASSGLGYEYCKAFAENGAKVAAFARRKEKLETLKGEIEAMGGECLPVPCDVGDEAQVVAGVRSVIDTFGKVDILVNNAGITRDALLLRLSEADFDAVLATNLRGAFLCMKQASKLMMKQRFGRIINISSVVALRGNAGQVNYAASKAGIIGMTKSLAKELASRKVTVNALAPGFIETAMTADLPEAARSKMLESMILKVFYCLLTGKVAFFLLSPNRIQFVEDMEQLFMLPVYEFYSKLILFVPCQLILHMCFLRHWNHCFLYIIPFRQKCTLSVFFLHFLSIFRRTLKHVLEWPAQKIIGIN